MQDNIFDSFFPFLEVEKRGDMFDIRMIILRIASAAALVYASSEFLKDPKNLEDVLSGSTEVWGDLFEWSQNKMMGVADNTT